MAAKGKKAGRKKTGAKAPLKLSITRVAAAASARELLARSVRATTAAGDDTITLRFEFTGGPARLIELRDNETPIIITDPVGPWKYNADHDPDGHVIEWHLFAPGRTLKDLKAFASLNGGAQKVIRTAPSSDGGWIDGGTLR
jgi:hypothetical protein